MSYIIFIKLFFSIIDALTNDMNNGDTSKDRDRASKLVNSLDPKFIISTMFLADLMENNQDFST